MDRAQPKVICLEIDGATWDIIDPLIGDGKLQNFKFIKENGAWGKLHSIHPLFSPVLWTTIATGKRREKHKVRFWGERARSVRARCKRIWDIFDEHGLRIGLCGNFMTWPPYPVNGFIIPSLFSPTSETYPSELQFVQRMILSEKRSAGGRTTAGMGRMVDLLALARNGLRVDTALSLLAYVVRERVGSMPRLERYWRKTLLLPKVLDDVFVHLYRHYAPDFASYHFHVTDTCAHRYWKYAFPGGFSEIPVSDVEKYGHVIGKAYQAADRTIGNMLKLMDENTSLVIVSDHGSRAVSMSSIPSQGIDIEAIARKLSSGACIPARIGRRLSLYFPDPKTDVRAIAAKLSQSYLMENSRRFTPWKLSADAEEGIVMLRLYPLQAALSEGKISPDATLVIPGTGDFSLKDLLTDTDTDISGTHDDVGIFGLYGALVRKAEQAEASILDIAPTMLLLMGFPQARDMDGEPLVDLMKEDLLSIRPIESVESYEEPSRTVQVSDPLSESEMGAVTTRLKNLGYL